jgi:hypothetical protein
LQYNTRRRVVALLIAIGIWSRFGRFYKPWATRSGKLGELHVPMPISEGLAGKQ